MKTLRDKDIAIIHGCIEHLERRPAVEIQLREPSGLRGLIIGRETVDRIVKEMNKAEEKWGGG